MQSQRNGKGDAQHILRQNQSDDGNSDTHTQLCAALFNELPRRRQSHAGEKDIHEPFLQYRYIPVHRQNPAAPEQSQRQTDQQTADNDAGNTIGLEKFHPFYDTPSHHHHRRGNGTTLHDVK